MQNPQISSLNDIHPWATNRYDWPKEVEQQMEKKQ
jgi:hypothetical protein